MRPALLVSLVVLSAACTIRVIQPAPAAAPGGAGGAGGGPKPDSAKKDLPWKPFAEVTKDARVQTGLFTVYLKARPRLPHGHGPVPGDRRAGHRRRQRCPLRSHPVPPGRRPRRAVGREPLRHGDAQHADGAHRRLLVWELGGSVVSDRRHPRHHERSARRSRPVPRVRLGRSGRVLPVPFADNAYAGPRPDVRQGALQLPVAAGVPDQHGGRGPADLPDQPEPRDGHGSGLPLDSRRRPLLDPRAACVRATRTTGSATSSRR